MASDEHVPSHAEYVERIQALGAVWPSETQRKAVNEFAAEIEAMGLDIQFSAPGTSKKYAVWTVYLKANAMQSDHGVGETLVEATVAACVRLLSQVQKTWDGDYLNRSPDEPLLKQVLVMARALPKQ